MLAVVLVAVGIAAGGLLIVLAGIHREKKAGSLTIQSPDLAATGARAINGAYVRHPGVRYQVTGHPRDHLTLVSQETRTP